MNKFSYTEYKNIRITWFIALNLRILAYRDYSNILYGYICNIPYVPGLYFLHSCGEIRVGGRDKKTCLCYIQVLFFWY